MQARQAAVDPGVLPFVISLVGLVGALVGGWLGGELAERLGISVYPDANVNAAGSLSDETRRPTV